MPDSLPDTYWRKSRSIVGPARAADFESIGQAETRAAFERLIIDRCAPSATLLDAGCNTGVEGFRLFRSGFRGSYHGVDSNPLALSYAMENLAGQRAWFSLADLSAIPCADRSFPIVLSKDVIEHSSDFEPILAELTRLAEQTLVLSMFIKMTNNEDLIQKHPDGYFLNRYSRARLLDFVASRGFANARTIFETSSDEVLVFERS